MRVFVEDIAIECRVDFSECFIRIRSMGQTLEELCLWFDRFLICVDF